MLAALTAPAAAQDKVKVGVFPVSSTLPYFVAVERGFFKERNIETEMVRLIGGPPKATLDGGKTIANYWPYATTVFDFIRRAMPFTQPRSLTDQEVYALTAYLLARNKLIGEGDEMNATTLPKVAMPNRGNFVIRFPDRI